ncbi:MAG: low molecular weight phosphotyrosine protein phosphatase [Rhodospirillales bacterium]|nr:MAG: low molecular weight phosphotyrosine protein phosphatase [Rhodospirillales bacterium]
MVNVLFVCLGNICRSPAAEGMLRAQIESEGLIGTVTVDSAATHAFNIGRPPDPRAQAVLHDRGIDIGDFRARQIDGADFRRFDYIIAMDRDNLADLRHACPADARVRLHRLMEFVPDARDREVADPYHGSDADFELMADQIELGTRHLLRHIVTHDLGPSEGRSAD